MKTIKVKKYFEKLDLYLTFKMKKKKGGFHLSCSGFDSFYGSIYMEDKRKIDLFRTYKTILSNINDYMKIEDFEDYEEDEPSEAGLIEYLFNGYYRRELAFGTK